MFWLDEKKGRRIKKKRGKVIYLANAKFLLIYSSGIGGIRILEQNREFYEVCLLFWGGTVVPYADNMH